ncbi:unnamed protein product [Clonostachys byssicola]|uniref:Zn(2)-C6 fungal-type domain-containing protein n=1 Tax=Clonostachys byssicola TaxID=160290 RepID=A0A9N9UVR2_9HYPO|nr:unnamed protein product [Clonostachys byssicola]
MSSMKTRLAACEPCRRAKLACGHERPTCARCISRRQGDSCFYRARPFRRRNSAQQAPECATTTKPANPPSREESTSSPHQKETQRERERDLLLHLPESELSTPVASATHRYPNPGYLGTSSHSTFFNQVTSRSAPESPAKNGELPFQAGVGAPEDLLQDHALAGRAIYTLRRLDQLDIPNLHLLVRTWLGRGVNLPLAEPFVASCSEAIVALGAMFKERAVTSTDGDNMEVSRWARFILENTLKPMKLRRNSTLADFIALMVGDNLRWETLGIFFTAASRACLDTPAFNALYANEEERRVLVKTLTYMSDCCLETCLALDYLNGLQLVLQYENFVVHSQVDGDQSYHSWRRMGDLASSLFALGYHEKIDELSSDIPAFASELRKACFARVYAGDKSLAIFLGRPPRIGKEYCFFQIPANVPEVWSPTRMETAGNETSPFQSGTDSIAKQVPKGLEPINYMADTCCAALFAFIKEDILRLLRGTNSVRDEEITNEIRLRIEKQWLELPEHYRLTTSLKDCRRAAFERDFLVGTRLDYLHTHFLLSLSSQVKISEPSETMLEVAGEILSLIVETIILRDCLVNAGTSLIWKVSQYGLPAAGIISLALLNTSIPPSAVAPSRSKLVQDLSVLAAEITVGAWIQPGDPNFALFTRATKTIQSLLDSLISWQTNPAPAQSEQPMNENFMGDLDPSFNFQSWEFEMNFWTDLAEHPTLLN